MPYPSDLTDEQWGLLEPLNLRRPGKRGPRHGEGLRRVVDGMMYVTQTGCQWRYLPAEFGPWTRVWCKGRRWSRNGTWAMVLAELHRHARTEAGRAEELPSVLSCAA
jgi:putative transposase